MKMIHIQRWLENHLRALLFAFGDLIRAPIGTILTVLVIGIAMTFPSGLYTFLQNVKLLTKQWHNDPTISLYLPANIADDQAQSLIKQLQQRQDIAKVTYISPAKGLAEFQNQTELQAALRELPENPLPGVILITPKIHLKTFDLQNLLSSISHLPNVEASQLDTQWVERLFELMHLGERITYGLMFLFGIGVAFIVGNTIRMATQNHRQEILVLRLIGATSAFIRRPMLYRGALYGFWGGFVACLLVNLLFLWLQSPATRLAESYHNDWHLQSLTFLPELAIIAICTLLGLIGAWCSVQRYLQIPEEV